MDTTEIYWHFNSQYYGYDFIRTYRVNVINFWQSDVEVGKALFQREWCFYMGRGKKHKHTHNCKDVYTGVCVTHRWPCEHGGREWRTI